MRRGLVAAGIVVAALAATPLVVFAVDRAVHAGGVLRNVTAAGVDLSGLSERDAAAALSAFEVAVMAPIRVDVDGVEVAVLPAELGVSVPVDDLLDRALRVGRSGTIAHQLADWVASWFTPVDLEVSLGHDPATLDPLFRSWDEGVVDRPPFDGEIVVVAGGDVVVSSPEPGAVVDRAGAEEVLVAFLGITERVPATIPLSEVAPGRFLEDLEEAAATARRLIDTPVVVRDPRGTGAVTLAVTDLRTALRIESTFDSEIEVWLDRDAILRRVSPYAARFETPAVDAAFSFDEDTATFTIAPSVTGTTIDLDRVPSLVETAALLDRAAIAPIVTGDLPKWSTEQLEAMEISAVSSFTTRFSCCQSRVRNIHLIADAVDGAVVWPGERFSVNDHVGRRTEEKGYVRAGAIIDGEVTCCDSELNIGGGTSQFATTFYNAVFFGCYDDVEHQPHSLYFSRYPRGREATLGYPKPDVVFRNDTDTIVWIDTSHTATSVTVTFYGDTGGRVCTDEVEGRNPVTVTRVITHADGSVVREPFTWRYKG